MVADSGGPGKFRGGLGAVHRLRMLVDTYITGCADRHELPPWGLHDGRPGLPNRFAATRHGIEGSLKDLYALASTSKFSNLLLRKGEILTIMQGGGGGYGNPFERDPEQVRWDVRPQRSEARRRGSPAPVPSCQQPPASSNSPKVCRGGVLRRYL